MPSPGDYYRRLRLPRDASRQEIKAAFRRLSRQYHPDLHPGKPSAARHFRALLEAYEVLIDRVRRQRYDYQQGYGAEGGAAQRAEKPPAPRPTSVDLYIRGVRYLLARRYQLAISDYTQAIELDDRFAEAYLRRAEVRYLLEDDSGVLADCQRAIALNSTEAKTYFYQGMARYRLDYVQSAIAAFTDAITCDPNDAQVYYRRGLAYQDLHQLSEAARDFRRAAQLYREQGQVVSYQQLQRYLRQFGTAGRSRPVRFLGKVAQRLTNVLPGSQRASLRQVTSPHRHPTDFLAQGKAISPDLSSQPASPPTRMVEKQTRWPIPPDQNGQNTGQNTGKKAGKNVRPNSGQTYWAPGVSSRPDPNYRPPRRFRLPLSGFGATLRLLSNPGGEMLPLYRQLSPRQTSLVGYGLAVLANLTFVLGGIQHTTVNSWVVASWLWAAGGMMFVAMVLVVALTRVGLRIYSLWAADIFMLATAVVPLGMLTVVSAIAQNFAHQLPDPFPFWIAHALLPLAALWAVSQSVITLYNGFSRIHMFSDNLSAWFAPVVLALGVGAGVGTWQVLSAGLL